MSKSPLAEQMLDSATHAGLNQTVGGAHVQR